MRPRQLKIIWLRSFLKDMNCKQQPMICLKHLFATLASWQQFNHLERESGWRKINSGPWSNVRSNSNMLEMNHDTHDTTWWSPTINSFSHARLPKAYGLNDGVNKFEYFGRRSWGDHSFISCLWSLQDLMFTWKLCVWRKNTHHENLGTSFESHHQVFPSFGNKPWRADNYSREIKK